MGRHWRALLLPAQTPSSLLFKESPSEGWIIWKAGELPGKRLARGWERREGCEEVTDMSAGFWGAWWCGTFSFLLLSSLLEFCMVSPGD